MPLSYTEGLESVELTKGQKGLAAESDFQVERLGIVQFSKRLPCRAGINKERSRFQRHGAFGTTESRILNQIVQDGEEGWKRTSGVHIVFLTPVNLLKDLGDRDNGIP